MNYNSYILCLFYDRKLTVNVCVQTNLFELRQTCIYKIWHIA